MTLQYEFRPIDNWPWPKTKARKRSQFKASMVDTLKLLERELHYLDARHVVIQANCEEAMIRRDGMLRSDARMRGPEAILTFESKHGPLQYPCDTFTAFYCNVRAIALALEALRAVDRYGVTRKAEQYKGWAKLPGQVMEVPMTPQQAAGIILAKSGSTERVVSKNTIDEMYRRACAKTHPDTGGNAEEFKRVQQAKEILDRHFATAG